jgi:glycolate oxidase FAD binding subunit
MSDPARQFADRIVGATGPLRIRGGGSKDFYGNAPAGEILDTRGHSGIVGYEPTELVITARCGTPLAEIETVLTENRQMLAFEPPAFVVAAGLSGPRRATAGAVRDFVLGVKVLDGRGHELDFGGQVMKNVAGYDVSRLMAGSLGTLGLILEVSLKVLPSPAAEATLRFDLPAAKALDTMNSWAGRPLPLSATCWHDDVLTVRLSGAGAAVRAACASLGGEKVGDGDAAVFWAGLREQRLDFFAGAEALWRLSLPSVAGVVDLPGPTLVEWGGAQRWLRCAAGAAEVRAAAASVGGHATLFRGGDRSGGALAPLDPVLARIHRDLKRAFDPRGIFNPGRLYPDF